MNIRALAVSVLLMHPAASEDADAFIRNTLQVTQYKVTAVSLTKSGQELLVYATDPNFCGSGGCTLFVIARHAGSYRMVSQITVVRLPIRVLATSTLGWRDLGVEVAGGGITKDYEVRLSYNGKTYPANPTIAPARPLSKVIGRIVLAADNPATS